MQPPLIIVGSGAVATLFAVQLASTGIPVTMLATWKEGIEAIQQEGVKAICPDGSELAARVKITNDPFSLDELVDDALILVKAWQTERAARQVNYLLAEDGIALSLQNGLSNRETLVMELGASRTACGVIVLGAQLVQPGVVKTTGHPLVQLEKNEKLKKIRKMLEKANFRVEEYEDISVIQWRKLIINAVINPLSAVLGFRNAELVSNPYAHDLLATLISETVTIAEAAGVNLDADMQDLIHEVIKKTGANQSSMLQDKQRGAPTEIEAINGFLLRVAEAVGIDAPLNRSLISMIKATTPEPPK